MVESWDEFCEEFMSRHPEEVEVEQVYQQIHNIERKPGETITELYVRLEILTEELISKKPEYRPSRNEKLVGTVQVENRSEKSPRGQGKPRFVTSKVSEGYPQGYGATASPAPKVPCYICGGPHFLRRDCPFFKRKLCYACGGQGHLSRDCRLNNMSLPPHRKKYPEPTRHVASGEKNRRRMPEHRAHRCQAHSDINNSTKEW
ncbi:hypothetical protein SK128_009683 [Halocaridina rubra]|uniref:CCHC-type domain-containing protein n=1 Tax=Halocaridina rubra TaxID=373956 RepID=A0AAN8XE51_HALRR